MTDRIAPARLRKVGIAKARETAPLTASIANAGPGLFQLFRDELMRRYAAGSKANDDLSNPAGTGTR